VAIKIFHYKSLTNKGEKGEIRPPVLDTLRTKMRAGTYKRFQIKGENKNRKKEKKRDPTRESQPNANVLNKHNFLPPSVDLNKLRANRKKREKNKNK
jgi:hypothetical protein